MQVAVDTVNHLIVTHEVTNIGSDRAQLANVAREAKAVLQVDQLEAVADRGYFNGEEILACVQAGIWVTLPKPMTSGAKSEGRFGKQDFVYLPEEDVYRCPAGERLTFHYVNEENGQKLRRYWTNACGTCAIKHRCTTGKERRITRWEHEHVLETVQRRLDENPQAMRQRRKTVEHPFGTLKMRMGATHFLMKRLPKVATEMALHVLAYNLTRVMNIVGVKQANDFYEMFDKHLAAGGLNQADYPTSGFGPYLGHQARTMLLLDLEFARVSEQTTQLQGPARFGRVTEWPYARKGSVVALTSCLDRSNAIRTTIGGSRYRDMPRRLFAYFNRDQAGILRLTTIDWFDVDSCA